MDDMLQLGVTAVASSSIGPAPSAQFRTERGGSRAEGGLNNTMPSVWDLFFSQRQKTSLRTDKFKLYRDEMLNNVKRFGGD